MRFRSRLMLYSFPIVLLPLAVAIILSTITANIRISRLIELTMEYELREFRNHAIREYQTLEDLGIGGVEFYRRGAQNNVVEYAENRDIDGGRLYILSPELPNPDFLSFESHRYRLKEVALDGWGWTLGIAVSHSEFNSHIRETLLVSTSVFITVTVLLIVLVPAVSRRFSKPLVTLRDQAEQMSRGSLNARVEVGGDEEIIDLATSFNHMAASLQSASETLESQVRDRTAELESSLEELGRTQTELLARERLKTVGLAAAGIAHDLETPLGVGITASSHLMELSAEVAVLLDSQPLDIGTVVELQESIGQGVELMHRQFRRAVDLVGRFKQLAVDEGNETRRVFDVQAHIREIVDALDSETRQERVQIAIELEPLLIESYPGHFYQIVTNLILNSLRHAFPDGQGGRISISGTLIGDVFHLEYRDDGIGMDQYVLEHVFDPFFTTKREEGGSGLGMNIVHNSVTRGLGGKISITSVPGDGIRVSISVPLS